MTSIYKALAAAILAASLAACGGGGGSAGTNPNAAATPAATTPATTASAPTAQAVVADFALLTDKTTIANTGTDSAKLTVVAVDANRNIVPSAPVSVTTDANSFFVPGGTATDATGTYTGIVQSGGDKTDRDITVSVTVNGIVKRTTLRVAGSKLTISTPAPSVTPGTNVVVTASLRDSAGNPIAGQSIRLGGTVASAIALAPVTTNPAGDAVFPAFVAPATTGAYTITATGGGTTSLDYALSVFSAGAVPAAAIPPGATAPSLSATPKVLAVNAVGSSTSRTTLRFQYVNNNVPIPNVRVQFVDLTAGLPRVNASLSTAATLYTDASGTATAQYISGNNSSPTDGVTIRACYSANDMTTDQANPTSDVSLCKIGTPPVGVGFVDTKLTVAGQAVSVSIGDDNKLTTGAGNVTYIKKFAVTVADSAGVAVPNANVNISVDLTHYGKGNWVDSYMVSGNPVLGISVVPIGLTAAYPDMTVNPSGTGQRVWCPNEDVNRNGIVDPTAEFVGFTSENYNASTDGSGQATLDPRKSDLLISYVDPTVTKTDARGVLLVQVEYAQRFATWLAYKIRVTADVSGSQGVAERTFVTDFLDADKLTGSFISPPYGINRCIDAN